MSKETEILSGQNKQISSLISLLKSQRKSDEDQPAVAEPLHASSALAASRPATSPPMAACQNKKAYEISAANQYYAIADDGRIVVPVTGRPMVIDESIIGAEEASLIRRYISECPSGTFSNVTAAWFRRYMDEFPNGPIAIRLGPNASALMRRYALLKADRRRAAYSYRQRILRQMASQNI